MLKQKRLRDFKRLFSWKHFNLNASLESSFISLKPLHLSGFQA